MLPFGSTPFGQGYIGRGDWGRRVFWENVPGEHRELDTAGHLEGLLRTWADEYEKLLLHVLTLPQQRDPFQAIAAGTMPETMLVTAVVVEAEADYGTVVKLIEERDPSALPIGYAAISNVGPAWIAEFEDGRWPVVLVRTRNADAVAYYDAATSLGNEVWCSTGDMLPFAYTAEVIGAGDGTAAPAVAPLRPVRFAANSDPAMAITAAGVAVTFRSTLGGADVTVYDNGAGLLREDAGGFATGNRRGTVDYDAGTITMDVDWDVPGDTVVNATDITATYTVRGYYLRLRPQSMLERLHRDFGLVADTGAPDDVQRAALAHYAHYMGKKGTASSYAVLGSIYLFTVTATGLWEVCDVTQVADYPAAHVFTVGGRIFTDVDPRRLRYDDIAADAEYYDWIGDHTGGAPGLVPLLDREVIYDDNTTFPAGDGWSAAKGFAVDVTQGYYYPARAPATVTSVAALTAAELLTYGLAAGWRVVVSMSAAQKAEFNWTCRGRFALTCYDKVGLVPPSWTAEPYWIDADEGWDPGLLEWTVIIGASSLPAAWSNPMGVHDVAVRYWPEVDMGDCCYCRSNFVRIRILPTAEGAAHYGASLVAGAPYRRARERLEARIEELLMPSHVRVLEYVYTP